MPKYVFLDIDNTMILLRKTKEVVYTGYSCDRWRAFIEVLNSAGYYVGIMTYKGRGTDGRHYDWGVQEKAEDLGTIEKSYDDIASTVLGFGDAKKSIRDLVQDELICFTDGKDKHSMLQAFARERSINLSDIIIIDDKKKDVIKPARAIGITAFHVPKAVYAKQSCRYDSEEACIQLMIKVLVTLGLMPIYGDPLYKRLCLYQYPPLSRQMRSDKEGEQRLLQKAVEQEPCCFCKVL